MILVWLIILGFIPAIIACSKGRNFLAWYVYGVILLPIAFVHSIVISKTREQIAIDKERAGYARCPFCQEFIEPGATICSHCQREIGEILQQQKEEKNRQDEERAKEYENTSTGVNAFCEKNPQKALGITIAIILVIWGITEL